MRNGQDSPEVRTEAKANVFLTNTNKIQEAKLAFFVGQKRDSFREGITAACLLLHSSNLSSFLRTLENKLGIREFIQLTTLPEKIELEPVSIFIGYKYIYNGGPP